MTAYTMNWNPNKYPIKRMATLFRRGDTNHVGGWPFASHKQAKIGDAVYIRRSGKDRPGIILRARITNFTKPHWATLPLVQFKIEKAADLAGKSLVSDDILNRLDPHHDWDNENPGCRIKNEKTENALLALTMQTARTDEELKEEVNKADEALLAAIKAWGCYHPEAEPYLRHLRLTRNLRATVLTYGAAILMSQQIK